MEDYEINDVRQRRRTLNPLVNIDVDASNGFIIYLTVTNDGDFSAEDVKFNFPENFYWLTKEHTPNLFTRGIKHFLPRKTFTFLYGTFTEILKEGSPLPAVFDVSVSYLHPELGQRVSEQFHIDLMDYVNAIVVRSELYEHSKKLEEAISKLTREVSQINAAMSSLAPIGDATGLCLSIPALKNLRHLLLKDDLLEKIDPTGCNHKVFMEVLGVDFEMGFRLRDFFGHRNQDKKLRDIEGMTEELIEKIQQHFIIRHDI
jgi:hypothetical protein